MKTINLTFTLLLFPFIVLTQNSQKDSLIQLQIQDTVCIYECNISHIRSGNSVTYKIDKKEVTKEEFQRVTKGFKAREKCNPCYLKIFDLGENLLSMGLFFYSCPGQKTKEEVIIKNKNSANIIQQSSSCKHGEWNYFKSNGKIKKVEHYNYGTLVN